MIRLIIRMAIVIIMISANLITAQEFQGQATYQSKTSMSELKIDSPNMTEEMKKTFQENMKKAFEKTYTLSFNKTESVYEEEQKLEAPAAGSGGMMSMLIEGSGKKYKNIRDKKIISEEESFGKEFLIVDSLRQWNWKLESETKKIGDYTCYKAISIIPVTEKDKADYEKAIKDKKDSATSFFIMDEPKEQVIAVWYTPEIPVSQGPEEYWGLPGLILEANAGNTAVLCSKVVLNPKEKIRIKVPKKGKQVTKEEYGRLIERQMEQMKDEDGNIKIEIHR